MRSTGTEFSSEQASAWRLHPWTRSIPIKLLKNADLALYRAKTEARGSIQEHLACYGRIAAPKSKASYNKLAVNHLAFVKLASIQLWPRVYEFTA